MVFSHLVVTPYRVPGAENSDWKLPAYSCRMALFHGLPA